MKKILMFLGLLFGIFNTLPIPWRLRLLWLRGLYFMTVNGTQLFPSILSWTRAQNTAYKMGKQAGEGYESIVQLEKILEFMDLQHVPVSKISQAFRSADQEGVPPEQLGPFLARACLDAQTADLALKQAFSSGRY
jgi:hypothetical protein